MTKPVRPPLGNMDLLQSLLGFGPDGPETPKPIAKPPSLPAININLAAGASLVLVMGNARQFTIATPKQKGDTDVE